MTLIIRNGISDSWLCKCSVGAREVFGPFYSSFSLLFNFDAVNWFVFELLLLLPIFFRLYGFGLQYKLTNFYNETRRQLIQFQFLFGLSATLCTILQIYIPQAPACVEWDGLNYTPLCSNYVSPSIPIVLVTILLFTISSIKSNKRIFTIIGSSIILIFLIISSILSGTTSISQAILSFVVGTFFISIYRFLPPIFVPFSSIISIILGLVVFIIDLKKIDLESSQAQNSDIPGICSCYLLCTNLYLFFRFVSYQNNYGWFTTHWVKVDASSSGSLATAVIPGVVDTKNVDEFGQRLSRDIIDGAICFLALLIFNGIISKLFEYTFFNV